MNKCEAMLMPRNKKQKAELDRYIKHLNLKTKGEIFILNCVLYLDWSRIKILQSIEFIKESDDGKSIDFHITMTAPRITTMYSTSNPYISDWWSREYAKSLNNRMFHIFHQMDYYTD
jgi:hypothetical protein